jgi:hypothetical protein
MGVTVTFTEGGDGCEPWARHPHAPEPRPAPPPVPDPGEDDSPAAMSETARICAAWLDRTQPRP